MLVRQEVVKELLHCNNKYLSKCRKEGMPYVKDGCNLKYDMEEVYKWHRGELKEK